MSMLLPWPSPRSGMAASLAVCTVALAANAAPVHADQALLARTSVLDFGATADGKTVNTAAIQRGIDELASKGGGTLSVPAGVFLSGALYFKPGVNFHLDRGAVLKCSGDVATDFPARRTRIEGHFEDRFTPALINADGCHGLQVTGEGTLDGGGRPVWDLFWKLRRAAPDPKNFLNLSVPRARLALIENSKNVVIDGITFKDSQFWNLHLYRCQNVAVQNASFVVPDDYKQAPSTDAIDVDSCQRVTIKGCSFSVTDDCIAMKGSKGPLAMEDPDSPPVEHILVQNCTFKRGHGVVTLGSEATVVRDVIVEKCKVTGEMSLATFKLRTDTPQRYESIRFRDITLDHPGGTLVSARPWSQYADLKGQPPPLSVVRDITLSRITGRFGSFGVLQPTRGRTQISDIVLQDIDLELKNDRLKAEGVERMTLTNVTVNGKPYRADDGR